MRRCRRSPRYRVAITSTRQSLLRTRRPLLKPLLPSAHANLCTVIEPEFNLVHKLSDKEYASAVRGQQILRSNWVGKRTWIEPRARVLDTYG